MLDKRVKIKPKLYKTLGLPTGLELIHDSILNKGTAFTDVEREALGLRGLLPARVATMETQATRALENYNRKPTDLERYIFLMGLAGRCEHLHEALCFSVSNGPVEVSYAVLRNLIGRAGVFSCLFIDANTGDFRITKHGAG